MPDNKVFAVIRTKAGSGREPQEDDTHMDGWYTAKPTAQVIYEAWKKKYPLETISLVSVEDIRYGVLFNETEVMRS